MITNQYTAIQNALLYGPLNKANATPAQYCQYLHSYYLNNGLYDLIQQAAYAAAVWTPRMKGLRNPAHRAVEFYVAKVWPGALPAALPIVTENEKIIDPIQLFWKWSNWGAGKQVAVRQVSEYGDWFAKCATNSAKDKTATRVFGQNIKPEHVIDFMEDERGFLTYIRIERSATKKVNGKTVAYLHAETWDKETGLYLRYELDTNQNIEENRPVESLTFESMGIDFVPFVHATFQDIGEANRRGVGCFVHVLDKIDEVNRMATRLHQILFRYNKPTTAVSANANDEQGRPLPAPSIGETNGVIEVTDTDVWKMPGMSTLQYITPNVDYASYLASIKDQMDEIRQDLPEIKYFEMGSTGAGEPSGRAIRLLLGDAVDKVIEVRGTMESALARLDMMALTMMQNAGLAKDLGSFDKGDFEHSFEERDVIALSEQEKQEIESAFWNDWAPLEGGSVPFDQYALSRGWSQKRVDDYMAASNKKILAQKTSGAL